MKTPESMRRETYVVGHDSRLLNFTACMLYGSMGLYNQEHIETVSCMLYGSMVLNYQEHIKTVACWLLYGSMVLYSQEHIRP